MEGELSTAILDWGHAHERKGSPAAAGDAGEGHSGKLLRCHTLHFTKLHNEDGTPMVDEQAGAGTRVHLRTGRRAATDPLRRRGPKPRAF